LAVKLAGFRKYLAEHTAVWCHFTDRFL